MKPEAVVKGTMDLGYPESSITGIGVVLLLSTIIYAIPRTSLLGAILLTGFLGGAVVSNVRVESPFFSHVLFPVYVAIFGWIGFYLRNTRFRHCFLREERYNAHL